MNTQPEARELANAVFVTAALLPMGAPERQTLGQAAALLRTQHADLERKDALLRQALAVLQDINSPAIDVCDEIAAITSELAK